MLYIIAVHISTFIVLIHYYYYKRGLQQFFIAENTLQITEVQGTI